MNLKINQPDYELFGCDGVEADNTLQLIDERQFHLEAVYLAIQGVMDDWCTIKDIVVWGEPAITMMAVLSLAMEVSSLEDFNETFEDATSFLRKKLEYLVSSQPTTVNFSDVAKKFKEDISNTAVSTSEDVSVFQVYITAAEVMLRDDVVSHNEVGSIGASILQHLMTNTKGLSVQSYCNIGRLATVGCGIVLCVICSLHIEGLFKKAYCTKPHPFKLGSRRGLEKKIAAFGICVWNPSFDFTLASLTSAEVFYVTPPYSCVARALQAFAYASSTGTTMAICKGCCEVFCK